MRKSPSQRPNYVELHRTHRNESNFSYFEISKSWQQSLQSEVLKTTGRTKQLPYELAKAAHTHAQEFFEAVGKPLETDCKKGCSHCCYQVATVFPFEAIQIARTLKANLSPVQLEELVKKMKLRVRGLGGLSVAQNINNKTPCPLLSSDGNCSIYEIRPLLCRLAHSFSVKRCRQAFQKDRNTVEIPISLEYLTGISGIIEASFDWLPNEKLDGNLYELCSAVLVALTTSNVDQKWANNDRSIFKDCIKDDT